MTSETLEIPDVLRHKIWASWVRRCCSVFLALVVSLWSSWGVSEESAVRESHPHGTTRMNDAQELRAWNADSSEWVTPDSFWESWAATHGGLRWGRRADYPTYADVSERDLMIIELPQGACLMEFWHRRWRRAQDVRRWSPAFNSYGGCPFVFD